MAKTSSPIRVSEDLSEIAARLAEAAKIIERGGALDLPTLGLLAALHDDIESFVRSEYVTSQVYQQP